ncbi:hypothetical protein U1Q18_016770 [Sarracenia purpurea var. burkii]
MIFSPSFNGHDEDGALEIDDEATSDGHTASIRVNGGDSAPKDVKIVSRQIPAWLSYSTPDEFVEAMRESDAPLHVKYLQTMVECFCMLGKVAAAGAIICEGIKVCPGWVDFTSNLFLEKLSKPKDTRIRLKCVCILCLLRF